MPEVWVDADNWISQAEEHLREKGFVVVKKSRLDALERLYDAEKRKQVLLRAQYAPDFDYEEANEEEREKADEWASQNSAAFYDADDDVDEALAELESIE